METLAFRITNDLLFAGVICDDAKAMEVQALVQARLSLDRRFREGVVHWQGMRRPGEPMCNQVGKTVVTDDCTAVNCLRCLVMSKRLHGM